MEHQDPTVSKALQVPTVLPADTERRRKIVGFARREVSSTPMGEREERGHNLKLLCWRTGEVLE
jgi:hypothetical protein